jgi:hypothetical protein
LIKDEQGSIALSLLRIKKQTNNNQSLM